MHPFQRVFSLPFRLSYDSILMWRRTFLVQAHEVKVTIKSAGRSLHSSSCIGYLPLAIGIHSVITLLRPRFRNRLFSDMHSSKNSTCFSLCVPDMVPEALQFLWGCRPHPTEEERGRNSVAPTMLIFVSVI